MTTQELTTKMNKALDEGKLQDAAMYRDQRESQQVAEDQNLAHDRCEWSPSEVTA
jgi:hypothetical protein